MRRYETTVIIDPDLQADDRDIFLQKTEDLIANHQGILAQRDEWGGRTLAYAIKKKARGDYLLLDYCGDGTLVNEMERSFRIDDRVLKYMTILLDDAADPDKIIAEIKAAQEAQAKREAEAAAAAAKQAEAASKAEAAAETTAPVAAPSTDDTAEAKKETAPEQAAAPDETAAPAAKEGE